MLSPVLAGVRMLCPATGKDRSAVDVASLAAYFPQVVTSEQLDSLKREWLQYQAQSCSGLPEEVDQYWHAVSKLADGSTVRFPLLGHLAKALLVLPHSSADVERHFSTMGMEKDGLRNRMSDELLDSLMTIKCNRGSTTCVNFLPTPQMRAALPRHVAKAAGRMTREEDMKAAFCDKAEPSSTSREASLGSSSNQDSCSQKCKLNDDPADCSRNVISGVSSGEVDSDSRAHSRKAITGCHGIKQAAPALKSKLWRLGQVILFYFPKSVSQSRLDGRSVSSACTVISALVVRSILKGSLSLPNHSAPSEGLY